MLIDSVSGYPTALVEMRNEIHVVFMPANTTSNLQPMNQGVISIFTSFHLRNTFRKAISAIESDGSGQSSLKAFWKGVTILEAI